MSVDSQPLEDSQLLEDSQKEESPAPTELDTPSVKGLRVEPISMDTMDTLPAVLPEEIPIPTPPAATRSECLSELDARILELQRFGCKWVWGAEPFHTVHSLHSAYGELHQYERTILYCMCLSHKYI